MFFLGANLKVFVWPLDCFNLTMVRLHSVILATRQEGDTYISRFEDLETYTYAFYCVYFHLSS
jgi:hypothetical protein